MSSPNRSNYGVATLTADTTLVLHKHVGKAINLSAAAGATLTLPPAIGSGEELDIYVITTVTSNSYVIQVANSDDTMTGTATLFTADTGTPQGYATASTTDTLTMNGAAQGGLKGAFVRLRDVSDNLWHVEYVSDATSYAETTPFSAAV